MLTKLLVVDGMQAFECVGLQRGRGGRSWTFSQLSGRKHCAWHRTKVDHLTNCLMTRCLSSSWT